MKEPKKHPSGRPIKRRDTIPLSIYRNPGIGPLVPRLQSPEPKDAIGFHRFVIRDGNDER